MLTANLPSKLEKEFESTAHLLYQQNSVQEAFQEAVELWLSKYRQNKPEAHFALNNEAYEQLKPTLERDYQGKWIVIADGKLQGSGNSFDDVRQLAANLKDRIVLQVGQFRPKKVELGWQIAFA